MASTSCQVLRFSGTLGAPQRVAPSLESAPRSSSGFQPSDTMPARRLYLPRNRKPCQSVEAEKLPDLFMKFLKN